MSVGGGPAVPAGGRRDVVGDGRDAVGGRRDPVGRRGPVDAAAPVEDAAAVDVVGMTAGAVDVVTAESVVRRVARGVLTRAVRGGRAAAGGSGETWSAAILGEFEETVGRWEAVRWAASGVWLSWRERRTGGRLLAPVAAVLWPADRLRRLLVVGVSAAVLLVVASQFVLTVRYVPSTSMRPTLAIDDRVLVDRLTVRFAGPDRGEVVLLAHRRSNQRAVFNIRVLGLPGDTISCVDGALWRNGVAVDEPYLVTGSRTNCSPVTVASGTLYVLGDDRQVAVDSRSWGPVDEADVVGRVVGRVWPVRRAGPVD